MDLVYFELNNWFSGRDYPNEEPFVSWIRHHTFSDNEWCKKNKLIVLVGNIDMSTNWCIIAPKDWIKENCPALLSNKKYTYTVIRTSKNGTEEVSYEKCISDFLRNPDKYGDVCGQFGWLFPEYTEENFGVRWVDESEEEYS